jgi:hypothetical protein
MSVPTSFALPAHRFQVHKRNTTPRVTNATSSTSCGVCHRNEPRYACPHCEIQYCSVGCYKDHGTVCTETFYKNRVEKVVQLQVKEKKEETHNILNRAYREQQESSFSQDELYNLLQVLETGDEQKLSEILSSSHIQSAIDQSIEKGELREWLLEPWHPWWRAELARTDNDNVDEDDEEDQEESPAEEVPIETLDERLLKVPSIESLRRPGGNELPQLDFNLVDILYSIAWTLRLYHGVMNAKEVAIPAAHTLAESSSVLSKDARYDCLEEVLATSVVSSSESFRNRKDCNTPWDCLAQDVALICRNGRRQIGRALLEAIDVIKAAVNAAKRAKDAKGASELRKRRKKIEFYLSWSQDPSVALTLTDLSQDITQWIADWKLEAEQQVVEEIELPVNSSFAREPKQPSPFLIREVSQTRRKVVK